MALVEGNVSRSLFTFDYKNHKFQVRLRIFVRVGLVLNEGTHLNTFHATVDVKHSVLSCIFKLSNCSVGCFGQKI